MMDEIAQAPRIRCRAGDQGSVSIFGKQELFCNRTPQ